VNCPKCGVEVPEDASKCPACLEPLKGTPPSEPVESLPQRRPVGPVVYASFTRRAAAYIFDQCLVGLFAGIFILRPLLARAGIPADNPWALMSNTSRQVLAINLLLQLTSYLYSVALESSPWQATVGKRLFGMVVTDLQGRRISLGRATARYLGKVLIVSFLWIFFTEKKQGFHDLLAGCVVVRKM